MTKASDDVLYRQARDLLAGDPTAGDPKRSFELNAAAAANGHREAVLAMGWYYLGGVGVPRDVELAKQWYRKSAQQKDARAMFSLGQLACVQGRPDEALPWFQRASSEGHARSFYCMARLYWRGQGVRPNLRMAELLLQQAAARKDPAAQRVLRLLAWWRRKRR
jgi:TPR repeat protein